CLNVAVCHMPVSLNHFTHSINISSNNRREENDGFNLLMKTVSLLYNLPSRKTITKMIKTRYDVLKDIWTDISNQSYLGITMHYQSMDLTMKSVCVGVFPLDAHHTAEYIVDFLLKKAISLINKQKGVKQIGCFAHTMSHLISDALHTIPVTKNIIAKVKTIVGLARRNVVASDELKRLQICDDKSERILQLEEYVYPVISKCSNAPDMLSREKIQVLKDLVLLMKPIENVIWDISGESYSTCGIIMPIVHCMEATISTVLGEEFKERLPSEIQNRVKDFELNSILASSTILDPRFKKLHFKNALAAINNLIQGNVVKNKENLNVQLDKRTQI
ncbi:ZBED1 protein, partial [Acromyrmex charruanus]